MRKIKFSCVGVHEMEFLEKYFFVLKPSETGLRAFLSLFRLNNFLKNF